MSVENAAPLDLQAIAGQETSDESCEVSLYRRMHFIRAFEQKCRDLSAEQPSPIAGSIHLCAGQEAVPVGAAAALKPTDAAIATYRGHGWALEFGVSARELLAEICQRADGINGGRAGSALVMAPSRGFIGENSIVGAGVPIAAGVAMAELAQGTGGVAVVSFGDGATSQGALHEGIVFAAARRLPLVLVLENNNWSEMTATSKIVPISPLARRAIGYGIREVTIDGTDPLQVRDAIATAAELARRGDGPTLLECRVPRLWGHYNRDIEHYRSKEDRAEAAARDPLRRMEVRLLASGAAGEAELDELRLANQQQLDAITQQVLASPAPDPASAVLHVIAPSVAPEASGQGDEKQKELTYVFAVREALRVELALRPELLVYGEDCGDAGGIFGATRNLQREYGEGRVFDTPIAESAILGSAVGAALRGMRPVVEIMWADFMLVALDQIVNQAANIRYLTRGECSVPLVVRMQQGATPGSCAQHSQCLEALLFHIPGLKIGLPSNPQDAYDMLRAAIADPDPTIIIEARALYGQTAMVKTNGPVQAAGGARWLRQGADLTIIAWGTAVGLAMQAAERLATERIEAGVLDLRWLSPLDDAALGEAVHSGSGRIVVVHEANLTGGVGAEIAARLGELFPGQLRAPVAREGARNTRIPSAPELQAAVLPNALGVVAAAHRVLAYGSRQTLTS